MRWRIFALFLLPLILGGCMQNDPDTFSSLSDAPELYENNLILVFANNDTGKFLDGRLYIDGEYIGDTINGNISIPKKSSSSRLTFLSDDNGESYEIDYELTVDDYYYDILSVNQSNQEIAYYKEYYPYKEDDQFPKIGLWHFKKMPITWKIEDPSKCWKTEDEKIRKAFDEISLATDNLVRFEEVYANPDINVLCYDNMTEKLNEYLSDIHFRKTCENITFEERKTVLIGRNESNISDDELQMSAKILSINNKQTVWEICKIKKEYVIFDPNVLSSDNPEQALKDSLLGEGGPTQVAASIIVKGEAKFLGDQNIITTCSSGFPLVEVHEIMHVLGFGHIVEEEELIEKYDSILSPNIPREYLEDLMLPYMKCSSQTKINEHYTSCLKYIYSNGEIGDCDRVRFIYLKY